MPFVPVKRVPFRLDLPGRRTPIPAFVMDPDTEAQVAASMDVVILGMPQKKPCKTHPFKHELQPPVTHKVTLRSGQPHPNDVPGPDDEVYHKAVHGDS